MKGVAGSYAFNSVPKTAYDTMLLKGFNAIVWAAGVESTPVSKQGAEGDLIEADK